MRVKPGPTAFLAPFAAFLTLAMAAVMARLFADTVAGAANPAVAPLLFLPALVGTAVAWGRAAWADRSLPRVALSLAGWLGAGFLLLPATLVWETSSWVAAGLLAGLAWRRAWRPDAALFVVAAALALMYIWAATQTPVREQVAVIGDQVLAALEAQVPPGTDPVELEKARAIGRQRVAQVVDTMVRLYPSLVGTGVLGLAVVIVLLVRVTGRRLVAVAPGRRLPPFSLWRLPFYLVWALAAGIGLMLTRRAPLADAGLNLAVLAASLLGVQGLAVQYHMSRRFLPPVALVIYWTLMGLAFVPLLVTSVLLGLADQWRDLRQLSSGGPEAGNQ